MRHIVIKIYLEAKHALKLVGFVIIKNHDIESHQPNCKLT